ncbi:ethanolamine ammonia-lyase subunit EutC [Methyloradius palustris]|uniref:Ethanolamine ammonia-lyase small subunit n=1 Tax=Methyloradius palustris TaxID=2778876 RepID=A0A8D5G7L0_9PROT|nr:ethanolamine ammonia-lyase subunit EutC [Methyloradius palustris]BCM24622.1 ethanolamine ammonia-lyase light chain [Methyloradius palustris]
MSNSDKSALAKDAFVQDPWQQLKGFTRARIALGRVGSSLPTKEVLDFGLAHAMARDAVHLALDIDALEQSITTLGITTLKVHSKAPDRASYLLRPDWGRRLNDASLSLLQDVKPKSPVDFLVVVGDGLSSLAVERHVEPLLREMQALIPDTWSIGPVVLASQARVAIADEIGETLGARMTVMLIGERPGLSSPDSLGIYLTYAPKLGYSDADRNCISNVRPEGLNYPAAAKKLMWLAKEAMRLQLSGVALKDESDAVQIEVEAAVQLSID